MSRSPRRATALSSAPLRVTNDLKMELEAFRLFLAKADLISTVETRAFRMKQYVLALSSIMATRDNPPLSFSKGRYSITSALALLTPRNDCSEEHDGSVATRYVISRFLNLVTSQKEF